MPHPHQETLAPESLEGARRAARGARRAHRAGASGGRMDPGDSAASTTPWGAHGAEVVGTLVADAAELGLDGGRCAGCAERLARGRAGEGAARGPWEDGVGRLWLRTAGWVAACECAAGGPVGEEVRWGAGAGVASLVGRRVRASQVWWRGRQAHAGPPTDAAAGASSSGAPGCGECGATVWANGVVEVGCLEADGDDEGGREAGERNGDGCTLRGRVAAVGCVRRGSGSGGEPHFLAAVEMAGDGELEEVNGQVVVVPRVETVVFSGWSVLGWHAALLSTLGSTAHGTFRGLGRKLAPQFGAGAEVLVATSQTTFRCEPNALPIAGLDERRNIASAPDLDDLRGRVVGVLPGTRMLEMADCSAAIPGGSHERISTPSCYICFPRGAKNLLWGSPLRSGCFVAIRHAHPMYSEGPRLATHGLLFRACPSTSVRVIQCAPRHAGHDDPGGSHGSWPWRSAAWVGPSGPLEPLRKLCWDRLVTNMGAKFRAADPEEVAASLHTTRGANGGGGDSGQGGNGQVPPKRAKRAKRSIAAAVSELIAHAKGTLQDTCDSHAELEDEAADNFPLLVPALADVSKAAWDLSEAYVRTWTDCTRPFPGGRNGSAHGCVSPRRIREILYPPVLPSGGPFSLRVGAPVQNTAAIGRLVRRQDTNGLQLVDKTFAMDVVFVQESGSLGNTSTVNGMVGQIVYVDEPWWSVIIEYLPCEAESRLEQGGASVHVTNERGKTLFAFLQVHATKLQILQLPSFPSPLLPFEDHKGEQRLWWTVPSGHMVVCVHSIYSSGLVECRVLPIAFVHGVEKGKVFEFCAFSDLPDPVVEACTVFWGGGRTCRSVCLSASAADSPIVRVSFSRTPLPQEASPGDVLILCLASEADQRYFGSCIFWHRYKGVRENSVALESRESLCIPNISPSFVVNVWQANRGDAFVSMKPSSCTMRLLQHARYLAGQVKTRSAVGRIDAANDWATIPAILGWVSKTSSWEIGTVSFEAVVLGKCVNLEKAWADRVTNAQPKIKLAVKLHALPEEGTPGAIISLYMELHRGSHPHGIVLGARLRVTHALRRRSRGNNVYLVWGPSTRIDVLDPSIGVRAPASPRCEWDINAAKIGALVDHAEARPKMLGKFVRLAGASVLHVNDVTFSVACPGCRPAESPTAGVSGIFLSSTSSSSANQSLEERESNNGHIMATFPCPDCGHTAAFMFVRCELLVSDGSGRAQVSADGHVASDLLGLSALTGTGNADARSRNELIGMCNRLLTGPRMRKFFINLSRVRRRLRAEQFAASQAHLSWEAKTATNWWNDPSAYASSGSDEDPEDIDESDGRGLRATDVPAAPSVALHRPTPEEEAHLMRLVEGVAAGNAERRVDLICSQKFRSPAKGGNSDGAVSHSLQHNVCDVYGRTRATPMSGFEYRRMFPRGQGPPVLVHQWILPTLVAHRAVDVPVRDHLRRLLHRANERNNQTVPE